MYKYQTPKDWKPIAGASRYAVNLENFVVNLKTCKRVKRFWRNLQYHSYVYDDNGNYKMVNHATLTVESYDLPDEEMRVIEDYPDYKVTPYGAVWKYRKTGRRYRNNPFLVGTKNIGDKEYIRLATEDGRRHWVRMEQIMEDTYPEH